MLKVPVYGRRSFLGAAALTLAAAGLGMFGAAQPRSRKMASSGPMPIKGELSSLGNANGWLNSQPLTADNLAGKVVLINFCTYTCINWLRTLPYVREWAKKYKSQGLVVIGVHTPEFEFEQKIDNVRRAVKEMNIDYAVAIDNDYAIWNAFRNNSWPALYLLDKKGRIKHEQIGEGGYEASEKIIQSLLSGAGYPGSDHELVSIDAPGIEAAADWENLGSQENYLGYERTENFASPGGALFNKQRIYGVPARLKLNHWSLLGDWTMEKKSITLNKVNGRIVYRFHARDLHLVMGPAVQGTSARFRVFIDGVAPGAAHGIDIDEQGKGIVTEQRLYQLIRQQGAIVDRLFEIELLDPGVEAFSFTFG